MEPHELPPQWWEQLWYFGGLKRAEGKDREWLHNVLTSYPTLKLGFLTVLPNALIVLAFGLLSLALFGDDPPTGLIMVAGAPLVLVLGTFVPWIRNVRLRQLRRKNSFD